MSTPAQQPGRHASGSSPAGDRLVVHNARAEIDAAEERLLALLTQHGYGEAARFAVRLAFEEAVVNAFRHGHKNLPADTPAEVTFAVGSDVAEISVTDQGPGYVPEQVPDCTLDENLEKVSGRGLMLIRSFMTDVRHEMGGRRLVMTYRKDAEAA
ncbi:MAG: ATP-binding protein [Phycisphaerales bacterium]